MAKLHLHQQMIWWLTGEVAEQVHKYESPADAVGTPIISAAIATALWYTGLSIVTLDSIVTLLAALGAYLLASLVTLMFSIQLTATIIYAREDTEIPAEHQEAW